MSFLKSVIPRSRAFYIKWLKKLWFLFMIVIIFFIFIINQEIGILVAVGVSLVFLIYYIPSFSFKNRLIRFMNKYPTIDDRFIANEFNRSLEEITEIMRKMSLKQKRSKFLIIYLNKRCVFYHENVVNDFVEFYYRGWNEKKIFEKLNQKVSIKTRAEIKTIENTLISQNRLLKNRQFEEENNEGNIKTPL